jgi:SpoVK/Ycf46/Vps4 family AAA+-type ATPase
MKRKIMESDSDVDIGIKCFKDLLALALAYPKQHKGNQDIEKLWKIRGSLKKLDNLVGLDDMKQDISNQILFMCQNMQENEMMHTVLMGPPGVGKTTVAKIIGEIYAKLGNLSKGTFTTAGREDLVAEYLGQTAVKTKKLLTSCKGGVLFIDEAYSLGNSGSDQDSFSKECIDTITKFLSENPKDFVCVIAGYEDELKKCFFKSNPGLDRRFPWKYTLKQYDSRQLSDIFEKKVIIDKWRLKDVDVRDSLIKVINENKDKFKNNGGDIENFLSSCKIMHSKRSFGMSKQWKRYLTVSDIEKGMELYVRHSTNGKINEKTIIPHMYL